MTSENTCSSWSHPSGTEGDWANSCHIKTYTQLDQESELKRGYDPNQLSARWHLKEKSPEKVDLVFVGWESEENKASYD